MKIKSMLPLILVLVLLYVSSIFIHGYKNILRLIFVLAVLYVSSVFIRGYLWESKAENFLLESVSDFAKPWNAERLWVYASDEMRNNPILPPNEFAVAAEGELGNLIEIIGGPNCELNSGTHQGSPEKHIYALCEMTAKFVKKTVHMKIRLIEIEEGSENSWRIFNFLEIK